MAGDGPEWGVPLLFDAQYRRIASKLLGHGVPSLLVGIGGGIEKDLASGVWCHGVASCWLAILLGWRYCDAGWS